MSQVIPNLLYSKEHEWVEVLGDNQVRIGISDFAQQQLGDIVFVELPQADGEVTVNQSIGTIESVKAVSEIFSPVSGRVVEVNGELDDVPETINGEPYDGGWMVVVELFNPDELKDLMTAEQYTVFIEEE